MRSSKIIIKSNAKKWLDLVLDVQFMTLLIFNYFFSYSLNSLYT
jgi:hypothetical protein